MARTPRTDDGMRGVSGRNERKPIPNDEIRPLYIKWKSIAPEVQTLRQKRGYFLQDLLYSILYYEGLDPRASYRPRGEEIDGSFYLNQRTFLLEAKWTTDPTAAAEIYKLRGKVEGKLPGTLGVFISMSGYSDDAPGALLQGKPPNVLLFDPTDMDAIVIHDAKFLDVLNFKLRQAGEVGKIYVPFELPKAIAEAETRTVVLGGLRPLPEETAFTGADLGFGGALVLVLCEGLIDAVVVEAVFRKLLDSTQLRSKVTIEIKTIGAGFQTLKRLPEIINVAQLSPGRRLSGVILVVDAEITDRTKAIQVEKRVEQQISKMAIPVPVHVALAKPSTEVWAGLGRESIPLGLKGLDSIYKAVMMVEPGILLANKEIEPMINFIQKLADPGEMPWQADARRAVETALEEAEWDPEAGLVTLGGTHEKTWVVECRSMDELRIGLIGIADAGTQATMPYEGGQPVFEVDSWGLVDEILMDNYEDKIEEMGWEL